jgi:ADP-heptose:LPS heptosyltransferase
MSAWHPIPDLPAPLVLGPRPRILVIKLATLGDLLLATPALRALRRRYPDARLDVLTAPEAVSLLANSPHVDQVHSLQLHPLGREHDVRGRVSAIGNFAGLLAQLRRARYDAAVLVHHLTLPGAPRKYRALLAAIAPSKSVGLDNGRGSFLDVRVPDHGFGSQHEADYALGLAAALDAALPAGERGLQLADLGWPDIAPVPLVVAHPSRVAIHPGSGTYSVARRWPLECFAEVAAALHASYGARVVLLGGPGEHDLVASLADHLGRPKWVSAVYPATARELAEMLSGCTLFIGNDSFPMHMAAAVGIPLVAVFGPSNACAWGPYAPECPGQAVLVRRDDLPCSPCLYTGHALGYPQGCPPRMCLTLLGSEPVLAAARRLLGRPVASAIPGG